MSSENHLGLPPEVFDIILSYLDPREIISCSQVCTGWRNAANSDRLWQSVCEKTFPDIYLKTITSTERFPHHHNNENESILMPLWKNRYSNYVSLKRNWKAGRYQEVSFEDCVSIQIPFQTDYETLFECESYHSYQKYNLSGDCPIVPLDDKLEGAKIDDSSDVPNFFKLVNNVIVIVHNKLMQVFKKDCGYTRKLVALFDEDPIQCPVPDSLDLVDWYKENGFYREGIEASCDHNGKSFVGIICDVVCGIIPQSLFHVWNLETLTKINEVKLPEFELDERILGISFSIKDNIMGLNVTWMTKKTTICSYNLEKMCYNSGAVNRNYQSPIFLFTESGKVVLSDLTMDKVYVFDLAGCLLTSIDTPGLKPLEEFNPICIYESSQMCGNLLLYGRWLDQSKKSQVNVYNLSKLAETEAFLLPAASRAVLKIHIHLNDIMIVTTDGEMLIRDMKTSTFLYTLAYLEFLPPDPTSTIMIVWEFNDVGVCVPEVLNFW